MHFVNDVDFEPCPGGPINRILTKLANLFNSVVCRSVDFDGIDILAEIYCGAAFALTAGLCGWLIEGKAVKGLCQNSCYSGFTNAACAGADKDGETPAQLRRKVTSPGGTTEAALKVFADGKFGPLVSAALKMPATEVR
ncbi:unnamed protein product, partial [marine sediment metagenome]